MLKIEKLSFLSKIHVFVQKEDYLIIKNAMLIILLDYDSKCIFFLSSVNEY